MSFFFWHLVFVPADQISFNLTDLLIWFEETQVGIQYYTSVSLTGVNRNPWSLRRTGVKLVLKLINRKVLY